MAEAGGRPQRAFVQGAAVLAAGSIGSRVIGIAYRVVLPILMGGGRQAAVGMGLFQLAYPIFNVTVTLVTTGIPTAMNKLVAERLALHDDRAARRVFLTGRAVLPLIGLLLTALLWAVAPLVARYVVHDQAVVLSIRAIAPGLFTISFASAYRGVFQGMGDMVPHAVSQIVEQICRVLAMFGLVLLLLPRGIQWAAAGASFGAVTGGVAASLVLTWMWPRRGALLRPRRRRHAPGRRHRPTPADLGGTLLAIMRLAVPIAAGAAVLPLVNMTDAVLVPLRLRAAGLGSEAVALYGVLTGYAWPLMLMPTVITAGMSSSLLPAVAGALAVGDRQAGAEVSAAGLRLAAILILPAAVGLMLVAGPLPLLLFRSATAAAPLRLLAPSMVFLSLQQTSTGVLRALGRADLPTRHLILGGVCKVALDWVLVAMPAWNVAGAALGTTVAFAVACALNLAAVGRLLPAALDWRGMALRPAAATALMAAAVWLALRTPLGRAPLSALVVAVLVGAVVYPAALLALRGLYRHDLESLPWIGPRLAVLLARHRLLPAGPREEGDRFDG